MLKPMGDSYFVISGAHMGDLPSSPYLERFWKTNLLIGFSIFVMVIVSTFWEMCLSLPQIICEWNTISTEFACDCLQVQL